MRRMRAYVDVELAGVIEPLERIGRGTLGFLRFFDEHPKYVELLILERALFKDRTVPTYIEYRERFQVRWLELYRGLIAEGRFRDDTTAERINAVVVDLLYGTIFTNYFAGPSRSPEEQARDILDVVFRGVLSEPERRTAGGLTGVGPRRARARGSRPEKVVSRMRGRDVWIAALLSCAVGAGCAKTQAKQEAPKLDEVLVSQPTSDVITDYEEFIGHTDAMYSVEVTARVTGYLDKVNFNDGDEVEKGALLFEIDPRPYQATFDQTIASLEQGKARLTRTTADHHRAEALLKRNAIGLEEYDRIQGDYAESKAAIGAFKATLDMAQLNLDFTKVTAPISGRLSRRMVDPGNLVRADTTSLTSIVSLDPMYVYFDIDERTMLKIRRLIAGGKVKSRTEAELAVYVGLSDEDDFPHKGTINFSDNKLDSSTGTLRVRGVIDNPKPRLLSPGLFVRIRLPIGTPHQSVMVAEQAIGTDQGRKFVYLVRKGKVKEVDKKTGKEVEHEGDVVVSQPIKVGALQKGLRVVDQGLALNDKVIVSGLQRVRPNKEVRPISLEEYNAKNKDRPVKIAGVDQVAPPLVTVPDAHASAPRRPAPPRQARPPPRPPRSTERAPAPDPADDPTLSPIEIKNLNRQDAKIRRGRGGSR